MHKGEARPGAARQWLLHPGRSVPQSPGLDEQRGAPIRSLEGQALGLAARKTDLTQHTVQIVRPLRPGVLDLMCKLENARGSAGQFEAGKEGALVVLASHVPSPPRFSAISPPLSVMTAPRRSNAARSADRSTGLISLPLSKRV